MTGFFKKESFMTDYCSLGKLETTLVVWDKQNVSFKQDIVNSGLLKVNG